LFVFRQVDDIEWEKGENLGQQGCSALHVSHEVLTALHVVFPNLWNGRCGPVPGPHAIETSHHWIFFCEDLYVWW